jgi:hypothetical protein
MLFLRLQRRCQWLTVAVQAGAHRRSPCVIMRAIARTESVEA